MAAKRLTRSKTIDTAQIQKQNQNQPMNTKKRNKNFSSFENDTLLKTCDKFHNIINKNSNKTADINEKTKAWQSIKQGYSV